MPSGQLEVVTTREREYIDITGPLQEVVREAGAVDGVLVVYNPHTTAGLTINEGADPAVHHDLLGALNRMVPDDYPYRHREGNSPSHMMATITGSSVTVLVAEGTIRLGTWQRIFFCEYDGPRTRKVWWKFLGGA
jgi:secondary thiamine-phosphate synthase enzyme